MSAVKALFVKVVQVPSQDKVQFIMEIGTEEANYAHTLLGGFPLPGRGQWVAIAPLLPPSEDANVENLEAQRCHKLAHALCGDPEFQEWACTKKGLAVSEDNAAIILRRYCGINHRSPAEFAANVEAQKRLNQLDYMWRVTK